MGEEDKILPKDYVITMEDLEKFKRGYTKWQDGVTNNVSTGKKYGEYTYSSTSSIDSDTNTGYENVYTIKLDTKELTFRGDLEQDVVTDLQDKEETDNICVFVHNEDGQFEVLSNEMLYNSLSDLLACERSRRK